MSQRSSGHSYRADSGRVAHSEAPKPAKPAPGKSTRRTDYTIAHAGHQFRLGPLTFWIAVGSLVVMAGWSLATGTYFAFHDDVLSRLIARQKEQQFAYEDRIAELRAQVDRITSRQLLNQEQFEQKLEQVMRRQSTLESRASTLAGVPPTQQPTGSIRNRPTPMADPSPGEPPKASPISDTVTFTAPPDREARLESRELPTASRRVAAAAKPMAAGVEGALARLQASLDRVEARQTATLNTLEERFDSKAKRIRGVLADLGMDAKKGPVGVPVAAMGGPFVPLTLRKDAGTFERQLYRVHVARSNVDRLTRTLGAVPVRKPIVGEIDLSSSFGVRSDPFGRGPAMHSGLDFRGEHRRSGARHRQRHGRHRRLERRLRQDGRDRPRQRPFDPLRPHVRNRREGRPDGARSARPSAASARPGARPGRICITRRASTATRSIRRNSCAPACGSATPCKSTRCNSNKNRAACEAARVLSPSGITLAQSVTTPPSLFSCAGYLPGSPAP